MANETLRGCVNTSNGQIEFDHVATGETCSYNACLETSGVHAGQIKVVINNNCCDDTYYGCFDSTNRRFEVAIPEECCGCYCGMCADICYAPDRINVDFGSISPPAGKICQSAGPMEYWNFPTFTNYTLSLDSAYSSRLVWAYTFNFTYYWNQYSSSDCTGPVTSSGSYDTTAFVILRMNYYGHSNIVLEAGFNHSTYSMRYAFYYFTDDSGLTENCVPTGTISADAIDGNGGCGSGTCPYEIVSYTGVFYTPTDVEVTIPIDATNECGCDT